MGLIDLPVLTVTDNLSHEIGAWLAAAPDVDHDLVWSGQGGRRVLVASAEHLAVLMSRLARPGAHGAVDWVDGSPRWGQTMRHDAGWVVEVHDGSATDYAQRVHRGAIGDYPMPIGRRPAFTSELWSPLQGADIQWCWLHGSLPEGCARTMRHLVRDGVDHGR